MFRLHPCGYHPHKDANSMIELLKKSAENE